MKEIAGGCYARNQYNAPTTSAKSGQDEMGAPGHFAKDFLERGAITEIREFQRRAGRPRSSPTESGSNYFQCQVAIP